MNYKYNIGDIVNREGIVIGFHKYGYIMQWPYFKKHLYNSLAHVERYDKIGQLSNYEIQKIKLETL